MISYTITIWKWVKHKEMKEGIVGVNLLLKWRKTFRDLIIRLLDKEQDLDNKKYKSFKEEMAKMKAHLE